MLQTLQDKILKQHQAIPTIPQIGDKVDVYVRVFEGEKERIQIFKGIVIKMSGKGMSRSFTVRKISDGGVGVERTFPLSSPVLSKVEVLSQSKVRRSKLYYIRKLKGRASRLTTAFSSHSKGSQKDKLQAESQQENLTEETPTEEKPKEESS